MKAAAKGLANINATCDHRMSFFTETRAMLVGVPVDRGVIPNTSVAESLGTGWTPGLDAIVA